MLRLRVCGILLLCALFAALAAPAVTLRGPADVASLTARADAVVRAQVVKLASAYGDGGASSGLVFTFVTLRPLEWWKGVAPPHEVAIRIPGGELGELGQVVQGAARFREGEEVVVFLRRLGTQARTAQAAGSAPREIYEVARWALGKFSVAASGRALRTREGLTCEGCSASERDELPLEELRGRVLESVRASRSGEAR